LLEFPSQEDIARIVEDLGKDTFDIKDFFAVMVKRQENPDTQIETTESFRVFDKVFNFYSTFSFFVF
jgi:Ca2+-binding EF-hand superfamily protein